MTHHASDDAPDRRLTSGSNPSGRRCKGPRHSLQSTWFLQALCAGAALVVAASSCSQTSSGGSHSLPATPAPGVESLSASDPDRAATGEGYVAPVIFTNVASVSGASPDRPGVAATSGPSVYAATVLKDAPESYYRLGETGTTAADSSGHNHAGTYVGVGTGLTQATAGLLGGDPQRSTTWSGLKGSYVGSPRDAALESAPGVSLEVRIKVGLVGKFQSVFEYGDNSKTAFKGFGLKFNRGFQFKLARSAGGTTTVEPAVQIVAAGTVHHVVGTYDGASASLYVDGQPVASKAMTGRIRFDLPANNMGLVVGNNQSAAYAATGALQEAAVYPTALSAASILSHYTAGLPGGPTPKPTVTPTGSATSTPTATPTVKPTPTPTVKPTGQITGPPTPLPTVTPTLSPTVNYTSWNSFGFDLARTNFNPTETTIGVGNASQLHKLWSLDFGDKVDATPVLAPAVVMPDGTKRNMLYIGAENGKFAGIDADAGSIVWTRSLGSYASSGCGDLGEARSASLARLPSIRRTTASTSPTDSTTSMRST